MKNSGVKLLLITIILPLFIVSSVARSNILAGNKLPDHGTRANGDLLMRKLGFDEAKFEYYQRKAKYDTGNVAMVLSGRSHRLGTKGSFRAADIDLQRKDLERKDRHGLFGRQT
ncbi:ribosomal protein S4 (RPS4A) family protein [Striga asiatica]|uniref:Ribosomal protein S4 (RPS4A) family protein n=1 Tax=Striga asiatica TaxID=4170 RepID=A0A5A7P9H3_STRAF|nr:ribosomal protein S4 (RPS4A) family protein [Striga asiatica]